MRTKVIDWWTENPALVASWSDKNALLQPQHVSRGSDRSPWWRCSADSSHQWTSTILNRIKGSSCPYCSGRRATKITNLAFKRPDLVKEWDYTANLKRPEDVTWRCPKAAFWICRLGHSWSMPISNRTYLKQNCPYCAGKRATPETSLLAKFPDIAKEWSNKNKKGPHEVMPATHVKYLWLCPKGHEYETSVASRTNVSSGCPVCAWQTSKLELRVYHELRKLLSGVLWHDKSFGFEIDVFLSEQRIGIELDGGYWHKDKVDFDIKKSKAMEELGITPLRVRDMPLPRIGENDIFIKRNADQRTVVLSVVRKIEAMAHICLEYPSDVWLDDPGYQKSLIDKGPVVRHLAVSERVYSTPEALVEAALIKCGDAWKY